ncbi:hypothetical protein Taro_050141, partial [Colocasia esculenta]|nr:hypothetical protein [Colocasia esculenta]
TLLHLLLDQHCCNHELLLFFSSFFSFFFPWRRCSAPLDADAFFPLYFSSSRKLLALVLRGDALEYQKHGQSVSTPPGSVSTHCPICAKLVFWELRLVSTHSLAVSTNCPKSVTRVRSSSRTLPLRQMRMGVPGKR